MKRQLVDWTKVPARVTGDTSNAERILGEVLTEFALNQMAATRLPARKEPATTSSLPQGAQA